MEKQRQILFAVFGLLAALLPEGLRAEVGNWTSNGPNGADVITLAAHPSNPSTVYAAGSESASYKSTDAGASWAPTELGGSFDLVVATSDASVAYAGKPVNSRTFYRTIDGGATWVDTENAPEVSSPWPSIGTTRWRSTRLPPRLLSDHERRRRLGSAHEARSQQLWTSGIAVDPADSRVIYASLTTRFSGTPASTAAPIAARRGSAPISGSRRLLFCSSTLGIRPASSRSRPPAST